MLRQFEVSLLFFRCIQAFYLFIILQQECNADTHIFVLPYLIFNFKIKTLGSVFSFECACISYITDKHFVMRIHIFCKWYIWILGRFYPDRPSDVYLEIQYLQLVQTLFAMGSSKVILYGIWYFVSQNKSFPVFRSTFVYISFFVRHNKCHFWITKKNIWRCWVYIYWRRQNCAEGKEEYFFNYVLCTL